MLHHFWNKELTWITTEQGGGMWNTGLPVSEKLKRTLNLEDSDSNIRTALNCKLSKKEKQSQASYMI